MLLSELLLEAVSGELAMAHQARRASHIFTMYVYKGNPPYKEVEWGNHGKVFVFRSDDVGIDKPMLILIGMKEPRAIGLSGGVYRFSTPIFGYDRAIMVSGMREFTQEELRRVATGTNFIEVFGHEYIHVLDADRTSGRIMKGIAGPEDQTAYFNDPAEFNAFYHDVARPLLDLIKVITTDPEYFDDYLGLYGFNGDWKHDLSYMLTRDGIIRRFVATLTATRRRSLLKRLYRLYLTMKQIVHQRLANSPDRLRPGPGLPAHSAIAA